MISVSRWIIPWIIILIGLIQPVISFSQSQTYGDKLGTVDFPVPCDEVAAQQMQRGLALLHHMMYSGAADVFKSVIESDPSCAMGYWGLAMTFIHPLWPDIPNEVKHAINNISSAMATRIYKCSRCPTGSNPGLWSLLPR